MKIQKKKQKTKQKTKNKNSNSQSNLEKEECRSDQSLSPVRLFACI